MGAPACPGLPWGLAFETWDPPRKGQSRPFSISEYILFIRNEADLWGGGQIRQTRAPWAWN
jgi:hypothetical protein